MMTNTETKIPVYIRASRGKYVATAVVDGGQVYAGHYSQMGKFARAAIARRLGAAASMVDIRIL